MDNLLNVAATQYSLNEIVINLLVALVFGIATAWVYKQTHKGVSYSQSYVISLVLVALTTSAVIMVIGNSLTRAFGLIGAFAVIRFRTAIKDPRDIAFIFFSLVEGMAAGTGNFNLAAVAFIFFTLTVFTLSRSQFGRFSAFGYLLSFHTKTKKRGKVSHVRLFDKYLADHLLLSLRSTTRDNEVITTYNIQFKDDEKLNEFLGKLKKTGATHIEVISSQNDIDY